MLSSKTLYSMLVGGAKQENEASQLKIALKEKVREATEQTGKAVLEPRRARQTQLSTLHPALANIPHRGHTPSL